MICNRALKKKGKENQNHRKERERKREVFGGKRKRKERNELLWNFKELKGPFLVNSHISVHKTSIYAVGRFQEVFFVVLL